MRLVSLRVIRLPGIESPFELSPEHLDSELLLVVGANASGKSSLCRAVRALLWPSLETPATLHVEADWRIGGRTLSCRREGPQPTEWFAGGVSVDPPTIPPPHLARCFVIGPDEVHPRDLAGVADEGLAQALRVVIAGGFDLGEVNKLLNPPAPRAPASELREAEAAAARKESEYRALASREHQLDQLRQELKHSRQAAREAEILAAAIEADQHRRKVEELERERAAAFPEALEGLSPTAAEDARRLLTRRGQQREQLREVEGELARAREDAVRLGNPESLPAPEQIEACRGRLAPLHEQVAQITLLEERAEEAAAARRTLEADLGSPPEGDPPSAQDIDRWKELDRTLRASREREEELAAELAALDDADSPLLRWAGWLLAGGGLAAGAVLAITASLPVGLGVILAAALLAAALLSTLIRRRGELRTRKAALERVHQAAEGAANGIRALRRQLKLGEAAGSVGEELLETIRRWHELSAREQEALERIKTLRVRHGEALRECVREVEEHLGAHVTDVASAAAALDGLARRVREARDARRRVAEGERLAGQLREQLAELEQEERRIYDQAGLDEANPAELERRVELLPRFGELCRGIEQARALLADRRRALANREELLAEDPKRLAQALEREQEKAGRETELVEEIARIEAEVASARKGHELADLLAGVEAAREKLDELREDRARRAAGRALLEAARESHARDSQPELLRRAGRLFEQFTGRRYRITVDAERETIGARDLHLGRSLGLSELSDGTRAQLWLAARLALAGIGSGAPSPPLFLDEPLAAADPLRFVAIVEALDALAAGGQQVIYLTADPGDVASWQASRRQRGAAPLPEIDLGEVRAGQSLPAVQPPLAATLTLPDPASSSFEEYAKLLDVSAIDPNQPIDAVHLLHLLCEDLELVQTLHAGHIETVGQWKAYSARDAVSVFGLEREDAKKIDALVRALEELRVGLKIGHPPRASADDLAQSGAVSRHFLRRSVELLDEVGGDGARLIEALREGRLPRFQRQKIDQLEDYLRERGLIDEREPHAGDELRAMVIAALAAELREGQLTIAQIDRLLGSVLPERVDA